MIDAYSVIALTCTIIFLPIPVYMIIVHRNRLHFHQHKKHSAFLFIVLLVLSVVFAFYNLDEISDAIETDIILKATGILLIAIAAVIVRYRKIPSMKHLPVPMFLAGVFLATGIVSIACLLVYSIVMFCMLAEEERRVARTVEKHADYKKRTRLRPKTKARKYKIRKRRKNVKSRR